MINPHELELIFASTEPSIEDKIKIQERYKNLLEYMGLPHRANHQDEENSMASSYAFFATVPDLAALKIRIENYASIHHITLGT